MRLPLISKSEYWVLIAIFVGMVSGCLIWERLQQRVYESFAIIQIPYVAPLQLFNPPEPRKIEKPLLVTDLNLTRIVESFVAGDPAR